MSRKHSARHTPHKKSHHSHRRKSNRILRWLWLLPAAAILVFVLLMIFGNKGPAGNEISVAEAYEKYQAGVFFLDVRTQEEWDEQHVPDSTLIPLDELPDRLSELPASEEIVIICRSGNRSREAMSTLLKAGFTQLSCVTGGIIAWAEAGYPVEP
jgi:rhodanese-related sulfurtransferase